MLALETERRLSLKTTSMPPLPDGRVLGVVRRAILPRTLPRLLGLAFSATSLPPLPRLCYDAKLTSVILRLTPSQTTETERTQAVMETRILLPHLAR